MELAAANITTDPVYWPGTEAVRFSVLRLDKIHPVISGNKWFKLRYYLETALLQKKTRVITFGGAWSNHIVATAAACRESGLASVGIIRGEQPARLSSMLQTAASYNMQLRFISRDDFALKKIPADLLTGDSLLIPEGGYGEPGAAGASTILGHTNEGFTHYCCAVGTGTMMAGLVRSTAPHQQVIGISVMKNNQDLEKNVAALTPAADRGRWKIFHDYHFGGYAKHPPGLIAFINQWFARTRIPVDIVYTGKLMYAVVDLLIAGYFPAGSQVLAIHSGGLQGNASLEEGTLIF